LGKKKKTVEIGRDAKTFGKFTPSKGKANRFDDKSTSIFDPALCEVIYKWFCIEGGLILDPFAGGSVRGIVANKLGYKYTGIDIRKEQIESNREQGMEILEINNQPNWYCGDSNELLSGFNTEFDFIFSCPPYVNLEVYSSLQGDISNMPYDKFMETYESIVEKSCKLLKHDGFACFVVGEVRDKNGNYYGFVPDTIRAFEKCGMKYYNEAIFLDQLGTAAMRADGNMKTRKLVKVHQNILIFKKA
jgi:DNA modification methylase